MRLIDGDRLIEYWKPDHDRTFTADYFIHTIEAQPTVNQWIPCSERLPEEKGEYLVTYHPCYWDDVEPETKVGVDTFRGKTTWAKKKYQRVVAWCELPEPYKIEDNE